jgi:hypothetical protein
LLRQAVVAECYKIEKECKKMKRILIIIMLGIVVGIVGCTGNPVTDNQESEVIINVQMPLSAPALTELSLITATVKAGPQDETVIAKRDLTVTGGKATGTLMVLAGKQRVFVLEAKDSEGQVMGTGQATSDVIAGQTTTLDITITFNMGNVIINTTIPEGLTPEEGIFFEENFSSYSDGQAAGDWGEGLIVSVEKNTAIHYLSSKFVGKSFARKSITFPDNFSFSFDIKLESSFPPISIKFIDSGGNPFPLQFEYHSCCPEHITVIWYDEENKEKTADINLISGYNNIQIVKDKTLYMLYVNGLLQVLGTYEKYSNFKDLEIYASFDKTGFTNFTGQYLNP